MMKYLLVLFASGILTASCSRAPFKELKDAMRPAQRAPKLKDDLPLPPFAIALKENIQFLEKKEDLPPTLRLGPLEIPRKVYIESLKHFKSLLQKTKNSDLLYTKIRENFDFYEVYGKEEWGDAFITSYYTPELEGSLKRSESFSTPLYKTPKETVLVDLKAFAERRPELFNEPEILARRIPKGLVAGRYNKERVEGKLSVVEPHHSREEIDSLKRLSGQKLEIAWLDPIDAFFLHIQGSGIVKLSKDKEIYVGYAAQNGHRYHAIGKELTDFIPIEEMSLQRIESHLRSLPKDQAQEILNKNPSYIFFEKIAVKAPTHLGTPAIPGRTIAVDTSLFPTGAVGFLEFPQPKFSEGSEEPTSWEPTSRFVFAHDTGGAIKGPHRVDLYWGGGPEAKRVAGHMRHHGRLYFLVPKPKLIDKIQGRVVN
jgi:membrane-bound lytic murein transglycosylase A